MTDPKWRWSFYIETLLFYLDEVGSDLKQREIEAVLDLYTAATKKDGAFQQKSAPDCISFALYYGLRPRDWTKKRGTLLEYCIRDRYMKRFHQQ